MNTRFTKTTILILVLSMSALSMAFMSLFFQEVEATVIKSRVVSLNQNSHSGVPYSNFSGNRTSIRFVAFQYFVNGKSYSGWGLANNYSGSKTTIMYFPKIPWFNISSGRTWLMVGLFLLFLAFAARAIVMWVRNPFQR